MPSVRHIIGLLFPPILTKIIEAKRLLAPVSNHPWLEACSPTKLTAINKSRFSILPMSCRSSLAFVIDVGANRGQWIGALLELLPIPQVWIFEPNPEAMKICQQQIGIRPGIKYFDVALGDAAGQTTLHVTASSNFASILAPRAEFLEKHYSKNAARVVTTKQVDVCTLDSLVPNARPVDLLKIDVQGFELAVLSGAPSVLANTRCVLLEINLQSHYEGDATLPTLWCFLANHGFSFWAISPPYVSQAGECLWVDAVFIKKDDVLDNPSPKAS
jgi:FkbM family methyltransferase